MRRCTVHGISLLRFNHLGLNKCIAQYGMYNRKWLQPRGSDQLFFQVLFRHYYIIYNQ